MQSFSPASIYHLGISRDRSHSRRDLLVPSVKVVQDGARINSATVTVQRPRTIVRVRRSATTVPNWTRTPVNVRAPTDGMVQTAQNVVRTRTSTVIRAPAALAGPLTGVTILNRQHGKKRLSCDVQAV